MVGHPFNGAIDAMVKRTNDSGAGHQPDIGNAGQFSGHLRCPFGSCGVADRNGLGVQPPARQKIFVGNDHPRTRSASGQRRGKACGAGPDDQHVTMQKAFVITIGVRHPRKRAKASCMADDRLIDLFPKFCRPHKSLVIKASGQKI